MGQHSGIGVLDKAVQVLEATTAAYPGWERRIEICGEFGSAAIEGDRIVHWEFREARDEDAALLASSATSASGSGAGAPDQISFAGHQLQIEDMVRALRHDTPLEIEGRQARNTVALVRAVYESAECGLPVRLAATTR